MKLLYIIYQICIGLPLFLVLTILTALTTMLGCWLATGTSGDIIREKYGRS